MKPVHTTLPQRSFIHKHSETKDKVKIEENNKQYKEVQKIKAKLPTIK